MSAAKMVADSTQSELADAAEGKKKRKKIKKTGKKVVLPEDEDSDLDLKKDLKPIVAFVKDRPAMIREMFRAVRGASLQRALPDLLKSIPLDELEQLCLEQLEVMSKKRIRRILAGEDSCNISSSGTEDDTTDEELAAPILRQTVHIFKRMMKRPREAGVPHRGNDDGGRGTRDEATQQTTEAPTDVENHQADSTCLRQEPTGGHIDGATEDTPQLSLIKQEPPDSGAEEAEAEPETYTSGSEDGELVRKDDQFDETTDVKIKQEPQSGTEEEEEEDGADEDEEEDMEEDDIMGSMQLSSEGVLPSIMMDQMELLELEMRARAIKAMLSSHDDGD